MSELETDPVDNKPVEELSGEKPLSTPSAEELLQGTGADTSQSHINEGIVPSDTDRTISPEPGESERVRLQGNSLNKAGDNTHIVDQTSLLKADESVPVESTDLKSDSKEDSTGKVNTEHTNDLSDTNIVQGSSSIESLKESGEVQVKDSENSPQDDSIVADQSPTGQEDQNPKEPSDQVKDAGSDAGSGLGETKDSLRATPSSKDTATDEDPEAKVPALPNLEEAEQDDYEDDYNDDFEPDDSPRRDVADDDAEGPVTGTRKEEEGESTVPVTVKEEEGERAGEGLEGDPARKTPESDPAPPAMSPGQDDMRDRKEVLENGAAADSDREEGEDSDIPTVVITPSSADTGDKEGVGGDDEAGQGHLEESVVAKETEGVNPRQETEECDQSRPTTPSSEQSPGGGGERATGTDSDLEDYNRPTTGGALDSGVLDNAAPDRQGVSQGQEPDPTSPTDENPNPTPLEEQDPTPASQQGEEPQLISPEEQAPQRSSQQEEGDKPMEEGRDESPRPESDTGGGESGEGRLDMEAVGEEAEGRTPVTQGDDDKSPREMKDEDFWDQESDDGKTKVVKEEDKEASDETVKVSMETEQKEAPKEDEEAGKANDEKKQKIDMEEIAAKVPEFQKENPLEQLLKKNVEIEGSVSSIADLESSVLHMLESIQTVMKHYLERLKLQPLKDFTEDLGKFRGDFGSITEAYKRLGALSTLMNQKLKELRHTTDDVTSIISRKFQNEDLSTWIDISDDAVAEKGRLKEEATAAEKVAMAKAAEARAALATATTKIAECQHHAAETELQATEAEMLSGKASAQARAALIQSEEAKLAAEERRQAEELSRRRSEARARQKEEEGRKKREQEELRAQEESARKGTSVEDERQLIKNERERKERERRNPKNWPKYVYSIDSGDFDPGVGCVIRAIEGSMRHDDVECARVDPLVGNLKLVGNEEVISNIVQVSPLDAEKRFHFEEPMSVAIPYCVNRIPSGREVVVKALQPNGSWTELPTSDVQFEDMRELRFVEARSRSFGTFVVLLRLKKDTLVFSRKTSKLTSASDSRITFTCKQGAFKHNFNLNLEVQALELTTVPDLKQRAPSECANLLTASSVINMSAANRKLSKSLIVTVPLPLPTARHGNRPTTAVRREQVSRDNRPQTARASSSGKDADEADDELQLLQKKSKTGWSRVTDVPLHQAKNKDIITFEIGEIYEKIVLLRTKPGTRDVTLEKIAALLETSLCQRNVQLVLRQRNDDASEVVLACTNSHSSEKVIKALDTDCFEEGPSPSKDLILHEGQPLTMKFRGNVKCMTELSSLHMVFNTHIRCMRYFRVEELDKFAQKGLHCYRGFVQIFTRAMVPKPPPDGVPLKPGTVPEMMEAEVLLSELLINLPKPDVEPPRPLKTAPVPLQDGPLTQNVLQYVAAELGEEWKKLAQLLNLKTMRIQAILRQNVNKDTPNTRYDMLLTWAKRIPKSVDKVSILCQALATCGRLDLAEDLKDRGEEFRRRRMMSARVSYLRQAFVKVAKTRAIFSKWQVFAKRLGVPEEDIDQIEGGSGSGQEKCYSSLEKWQNIAGQNATVPELAHQLRSAKHESLSREVESIMVT